MNGINFTGSFLLKNPSEVLYQKFTEKVLPPSKRTIMEDVGGKGNKLITVRDCYDREIAEYLLEKPFSFTYYPEANMKKKLNTLSPKEAKAALDKEKVKLQKRDAIREYVAKLEYSEKPIAYKWTPNDHIPQTLNALKLKEEDCRIETKDHITNILNNEDGRLLARVSPNNDYGVNYAFVYPRFSQDSVRYATIDYKGELKETTDIDELKEFRKNFYKAVKIDKGRLRPTEKS